MDNNFTQEQFEKLAKYMDNELSGSEKEAVEKFLATDESWKKEYENILLAREAVRQFGLKQRVSGIHQEIMKEKTSGQTPVRSIKPSLKFFRYAVAAAAAIVLGWFSFRMFDDKTNQTPGEMYAANFIHYDLPVMRGDGETIPGQLQTAYRDKNYNEVIRLYKSENEHTVETAFLTGVAMMETNDYAGSIQVFNQVITIHTANQTASDYVDAAEYFKALACLKTGEYKETARLFNKIKSDQDNLYASKITSSMISQVENFR